MRSSSMKTKRTVNKHTSKCKAFLLMTTESTLISPKVYLNSLIPGVRLQTPSAHDKAVAGVVLVV
jgi:hypothetical protein